MHVSQYEGEDDTTETHVLAKMAIQRRCTADVFYPFLHYLLVTASSFTAFAVGPEDVSDRIAISLTCLARTWPWAVAISGDATRNYGETH